MAQTQPDDATQAATQAAVQRDLLTALNAAGYTRRPAGRDARDARDVETSNAALAKELINLYTRKESELEAKEEQSKPFEHIRVLTRDRDWCRVGLFMGYAAAFASEDTNEMIDEQYVTNGISQLDVNHGPGAKERGAMKFASPKLQAHVIDTVSDIKQRWPESFPDEAQPDHFILATPDIQIKFARCVADAWRGTSVFSAKRYSTTKAINTLQTGADNLVLADTNEEGANLLALQTRQQLSTTALSLSSQADQAVLRLF